MSLQRETGYPTQVCHGIHSSCSTVLPRNWSEGTVTHKIKAGLAVWDAVGGFREASGNSV